MNLNHPETDSYGMTYDKIFEIAFVSGVNVVLYTTQYMVYL